MTEIELAPRARDTRVMTRLVDRPGAPGAQREAKSAFAGELRVRLDSAPRAKIARREEVVRDDDQRAQHAGHAGSVVASESEKAMNFGTAQGGATATGGQTDEGKSATISGDRSSTPASETDSNSVSADASPSSTASRVEAAGQAADGLITAVETLVESSESLASESSEEASESGEVALDTESWASEDDVAIDSSSGDIDSSENEQSTEESIEAVAEESAPLEADATSKEPGLKELQATARQAPQQMQRVPAPDGGPQARSADLPGPTASDAAESADEAMESYARMSGKRARVVIGEGRHRVGVSVLLRADAAEVSLTAINSEEAQALERSSGQLARALKAQGLTLDLSTSSQGQEQENEAQDSKSAPQPEANASSVMPLHGVRVIA